MRKLLNKLSTKVAPIMERAVKWSVKATFELLKLTGLAYMVLHLIAAAFVIEAVLAGIIVFASLYFTKRNW